MNGAPKENANPTIVATDSSATTHSRRRKAALEYPEIAALCVVGSSSNNKQQQQQDKASQQQQAYDPQNRVLLRALVDSAAASNGKSVSLLRNAGLIIPEDPSQLAVLEEQNQQQYVPLFVPASSEEPTSTTDQKPKSPPSPSSVVSSSMERDPVDADEIFEIIRGIQDPEHPLTLEQLGVVSRGQITVTTITTTEDDDNESSSSPPILSLDVRYTPTIPHCSMATLIGLCIRVKLWRSLPRTWNVTVRIQPGTHQSEQAVNKQLADKERVCAALENKHLLGLVNRCIANGMTGNLSV